MTIIDLDPSEDLTATVGRLLVCPRCHSALDAVGQELTCTNAACGFDGAIVDGVVVMGDRSKVSFFDDRHEVMETVTKFDGIWCLCYEQQAKVVEPLLRPGRVVLDVGCGPSLPYQKPDDCYVIGLEASFDSIRVNRAVDLRVHGTAAALPFPDHSVDTILCFYSIHHMTGQTIREHRKILAGVFGEFARVVKPGGELVVFEVSPWRPFWIFERLAWNTARKILGSKLDMHFWDAPTLARIGQAAMPNATLTTRRFVASMLSSLPPIFSIPWLRIPRFLYPFDARLYRWQFGSGRTNGL